ncbi:DNA polymerase III subunit beta [Marinilabilia salmonicolor]|jgi:DNA polymerase-3 subunit beta|uniref:Beta sliding clamp n=1 Tax=Marinilabilia salmonicolor TaxID=989 RepID=A0A2T0XPM5_9BACT|nr:DNA polymerase III subunit beta [Marinilabilia salmonicolor]PRZ00876.1 DNA polymerase-3 subunit beta [Marinilabilia salmonicolor]RCW30388.1 DNA polymerase-3 subunit beta [Marinilabilia salmonicolor]
MKFVVSSSGLLSHLQAISRAIASKSPMPILDNFLFSLEGQKLTITASDTEVTMITSMDLETTDGEGTIAMPSKILLETLKKFPEQPLNFEINEETMAVDIVTEKGKFSVVGQNGDDFPALPQIDEEKASKLQISADTLLTGIVKTLFATADDELRPVMNGILFEFTPDNMTFVASDSHKLVRYQRLDVKTDYEASFILPKKPAGLLKNVLPKEDGDVEVAFDDQNAYFTMQNYRLVCRLVEGNYPSYNAVIPQDNPNKVVVDRVDLFNTLGRVSLFASQASNLVKLHLGANEMVISAQDLDFSISAHEKLGCQYDGDEMEIGFKSGFLADILENISSSDIVLELSDPARAGIFVPFDKSENEDELMLLMPMMINA